MRLTEGRLATAERRAAGLPCARCGGTYRPTDAEFRTELERRRKETEDQLTREDLIEAARWMEQEVARLRHRAALLPGPGDRPTRS